MPKKPTTTEAGAENAGTALAELTPEQRAQKALAFETTRDQLKALAAKSTSLVKVDTPDNLAAAKAAKATLVSTRTRIEKTGKAARDDANKFQKAVIATEKSLVALISPEEQRLGTLIDTEQRRLDEAERVAREEEQRRAEQIRLAFERVRAMRTEAETLDVAGIDALITEAEKLRDDPSHLPEDLQAAARYEANVTINACKAARDRRVQADADAAELAELRRERDERERRAKANADEAARAATVVAANPRAAVDDDDDLPPGHEPAAVRVPAASLQPARQPIPDSVQVPVNRVLPLLQAAENAIALLRRKGLGDNIETVELAQAIEEARHG